MLNIKKHYYSTFIVQQLAALIFALGYSSLHPPDDCIPVLMLESVGVITVGGGVAGDWANTHQLDNLGEK